MSIPELEPYCGSWVIVNKQTGKAVVELFVRKNVENMAEAFKETHEVMTTAQYLAKLNREIKAGN